MPSPTASVPTEHRLWCGSVLSVTEAACELWTGEKVATVDFAPVFPTPRTERVLPGHLVAVATSSSGREVIVWRWFDAVVLLGNDAGERIWEPGHGIVTAQTRPASQELEPGSRVYASAGLPGADWWIAGPVTPSPVDAGVELDAVAGLYEENDLWAAAFAR